MDDALRLARDTRLYHLADGEKVLMVTRRGAQGPRPAGIDTCYTGFQIIEQQDELLDNGLPAGENRIVVIGRVRVWG